MHYLTQMRLFHLGPLCAQLVLKVTSSGAELNTYTSLQSSPQIQNLSMGCPRSGREQRRTWSQISGWEGREALTHNVGRCLIEDQTLPNL